jgi:WD40 repeat protein
VRVWDSSTGETLKVLEGHTDGIWSVEFSSDGRRIVSGSDDNSVRVWDSSTGETLKVLEGHIDIVSSVGFSSDGRRIVSGSLDKSVRVWDSSTGEVLNTPEADTESVELATSSNDDRPFVFGPDDMSSRVSAVPKKRSSLQYIRQRTVDASEHTGWLLSLQGHYLMFLPSIALLPDYSNILTIPRSRAAYVDFTSSTLGPEWQNCYHP